MERRIIRKKWQLTIPKGVRRKMGLHEGQTLNWQVVEGLAGGPPEIRLFPGSFTVKKDATEFRKELDELTPKKRRELRKRFGISDTFMSSRGREKLKQIIMEVALDLGLVQKGSKALTGHPPGTGDPELH